MTKREHDPEAVRSIRLQVEVPGTPEQVWRTVATGPGISAWFTPTEVAERSGGAITFHLGPGMDSTGVVTAWEPPHRLVYEEREWLPGTPPLAGRVERASAHELVLRTEQPAPGLALLGAYSWNEQTHATVTLYFYGDAAPAVMARQEPAWRAWLEKQFPKQEVSR